MLWKFVKGYTFAHTRLFLHEAFPLEHAAWNRKIDLTWIADDDQIKR